MTTAFIAGFRYRVRPANSDAFERAYGPVGPWADLFRAASGYLGTELWRATGEPASYLVFDRWKSETEYDAFLTTRRRAYDELNLRTQGLYVAEEPLGRFAVLAAAA